MAKNPPEVGYLKEGHSEENYPLLIELPVEPNQPVKLPAEIPTRTHGPSLPLHLGQPWKETYPPGGSHNLRAKSTTRPGVACHISVKRGHPWSSWPPHPQTNGYHAKPPIGTTGHPQHTNLEEALDFLKLHVNTAH